MNEEESKMFTFSFVTSTRLEKLDMKCLECVNFPKQKCVFINIILFYKIGHFNTSNHYSNFYTTNSPVLSIFSSLCLIRNIFTSSLLSESTFTSKVSPWSSRSIKLPAIKSLLSAVHNNYLSFKIYPSVELMWGFVSVFLN